MPQQTAFTRKKTLLVSMLSATPSSSNASCKPLDPEYREINE